MCAVSNIGDSWGQDFSKRYPSAAPTYFPAFDYTTVFATVTRAEFEALKKEMEELKLLLLAAKRFDQQTGQKDCQMDSKVELIKKIAQVFGVNMDDVFKKD